MDQNVLVTAEKAFEFAYTRRLPDFLTSTLWYSSIVPNSFHLRYGGSGKALWLAFTGQTEMSPADIAPVIGLGTERWRQIRNTALEKLRN